MLSLPEEVKLEMKCNGAEVGTINYVELKSKAEEVAFVSLRCNKSKEQLIQRTQAFGEMNRSYVNALVNLGAIAYPKPEDKGTKNDVLYNASIAGLLNKHEAERLVTCNMEVGGGTLPLLKEPGRLANCTNKSKYIPAGTTVADLIPIVEENVSYINAYSLCCISDEVDEPTTDDDVLSLNEQLHLNDLNLSDVEREVVIEMIRRRQPDFSLS
ncbi:unnamed protein product [Clavelina lepadiformis]|uniref:Uncharacterized protein n=1 Tax=Clavelina lepadiformis TaxID=159417 RepID=A0ABP0FI41_CLALP